MAELDDENVGRRWLITLVCQFVVEFCFMRMGSYSICMSEWVVDL